MHSDDKTGLIVGLGVIGFILGIWYTMACWTDRNLEFWLSYFKGEAVEVDLWLSALLCILGPANIFVNVIAEIAKLAV